MKTKDVAERLGDPENLPSVDEARKARKAIAAQMSERLKGFVRQSELEAARGQKSLEFERSEMAGRHRQERTMLKDAQEKRWIAETNVRAARLPRGFSGVWKRITGGYAKIRAQNEREAWSALLRDRVERDGLVASQLNERRDLQRHIREPRERQETDLLLLREDIARYQEMEMDRPTERHEREREGRERRRGRDKGPDFGY